MVVVVVVVPGGRGVGGGWCGAWRGWVRIQVVVVEVCLMIIGKCPVIVVVGF